jgi:hypothetical protein
MDASSWSSTAGSPKCVQLWGDSKIGVGGSHRIASLRSITRRRPTMSKTASKHPKMKGPRKPNLVYKIPPSGAPSIKLDRSQLLYIVEPSRGSLTQ